MKSNYKTTIFIAILALILIGLCSALLLKKEKEIKFVNTATLVQKFEMTKEMKLLSDKAKGELIKNVLCDLKWTSKT